MTLEEIARLAGCSRSTVSRVINHDPNVRAETRERVWRIIKEQDFQPNLAARALAGRRSRVIGLVIPQPLSTIFTDPFFSMLIHGCALACDERGYYLMLSLVLRQANDTYHWLIRARHLDGLLLAPPLINDPFVPHLLDKRLPLVMIGRIPGRTDISTVNIDNIKGASLATQHLLKLGYTRIATITGALNLVGALDRLEGYLCALREAGIEPPSEYIQEGDWSEASGRRAMECLLQATPPPEAVFAASDSMAIGAMKAIQAAGLMVPNDIAVVGFDDMPVAATVDPPLTTVHHPIERIGFLAASMLIEKLETPPTQASWANVQHIVLPARLVIRMSCGQALRCSAHPTDV
ncbi:MAG: LacI family transcriptional regulator [Caldilinea sp.]|nr:LacI family transcriptional regulator [Caldilinea sp.]MDW8440115.1 LacI family DNA-binding transcriptional regulator [Caldilineaceae bacterium]